jgi:hypothetical protein
VVLSFYTLSICDEFANEWTIQLSSSVIGSHSCVIVKMKADSRRQMASFSWTNPIPYADNAFQLSKRRAFGEERGG